MEDRTLPAHPEMVAALSSGAGVTRSRLSMLHWNTWHTWEHYGNIVNYLRQLDGLVPPSSEKR